MSFWSRLFGRKSNPTPPQPPVVKDYTVRLEVFDGDVAADNKIPGAILVLGVMAAKADDAGNWDFSKVKAGTYRVSVIAEGFVDYEDTVVVSGPTRLQISLKAAFVPLSQLSSNGRIFTCNGQPWRYTGVSAFKLLNLHAAGVDIDPFLDAYKGFNVLRVFAYTPASDWGAEAWDMPTADQVRAFVAYVERKGFYVELTLLTSDESSRAQQASALVAQLRATPLPSLLLEIGNEPLTHKNIDVKMLKAECEASSFPYASGVYEDSKLWFGRYGTAHTGRDNEWPRRSHDLLEYYNGGGPNSPDEPACRVPWVADEPIRPDQASGDKDADALAYYGACALLGAGATVHTDSGKFGRVPNADEQAWAKVALQALNTFPADAPLGPYARPVENSLRTYTVGPYMVRVRPTSPTPPDSGWQSLDNKSVLWRR